MRWQALRRNDWLAGQADKTDTSLAVRDAMPWHSKADRGDIGTLSRFGT